MISKIEEEKDFIDPKMRTFAYLRQQRSWKETAQFRQFKNYIAIYTHIKYITKIGRDIFTLKYPK